VSIAYLPNTAPPNNNTQQVRRRVNNLVSTVNDQIGSVADNTGDLGSLQTQVTTTDANVTAIQAIIHPGITGTVTLAKLTGPGANGSLTFTKGIITAFVSPT
jgi:hypothetical protein